jgi:ElaB/YqjD/DUF883 family membrane-anchored ribosome-binding protein
MRKMELDANQDRPKERNIMTGNAERSEKLVTDLKRVVRDSEELLQDSAEAVGEKAHELRDRMTRVLELAKVAGRRLELKVKQGTNAADSVIRDHPYQSLGIAFGVGVLIGVLVARK